MVVCQKSSKNLHIKCKYDRSIDAILKPIGIKLTETDCYDLEINKLTNQSMSLSSLRFSGQLSGYF